MPFKTLLIILLLSIRIWPIIFRTSACQNVIYILGLKLFHNLLIILYKNNLKIVNLKKGVGIDQCNKK